ncbi:MAG TPA: glycosyltransferase [Solirubrobacter sp.]|nr:glycosyltransferase [Solirubrobacter sp.]
MLLFVSYSGAFGGAERVLLDCVTRLSRPAVVACPDGPLADRLRAAGVEHRPIAARPLKRNAAGIAGLARDIARAKPDFVVAWGARAVLAAAGTLRPFLAVHHDLLSPPVKTAVRTANRRARGVLAASEAIARAVGGRPIAILHPGVDLERFTPRPLPTGPPHALVLGALVAWKRPELALDVAARVPDLHLTIAGATLPGDDGRVEAELRRRARTFGDRVRIGAVDDVPSALAGAHVLLHCADREPYGMALVEALAAGRPVVAPAAGGPREIVTPETGRLYPPGDATAAAAALRAVLDDSTMPPAARRRAERHFDVAASVARLEAAL